MGAWRRLRHVFSHELERHGDPRDADVGTATYTCAYPACDYTDTVSWFTFTITAVPTKQEADK